MSEKNEVEKALDRYRKAAEKDRELQKYGNQAVKGTADLATAQNYSRRAGEISSNVLENVLQGVEDEATRKQVISAVLKENYKNVIANTEAVQRSVNESAGVGLNPILANYDAGVADEISDSISRYESTDEALSAVANDVVVQSQKYADISMRKNAEFQSNSGMEVLVTREYDDVGVHTTDKGGGEVCQWCLSRCGTDVPYDEAYQRGMFERHPGCGCVITYKSKKGIFRQGRGDWGTNNWHTVREAKERERRIRKNDSNGNKALTRWHVKNVQKEYLRDADAGIGGITSESDYLHRSHTDEIAVSKWLLTNFGGNITLKAESKIKSIHTADYLWDGLLWDLKTPIGNGKRTIDNQFKTIEKQIGEAPGGMILDCTDLAFSNGEIISRVSKRIRLNNFSGDVIIKRRQAIIAILRLE